jgi:hypothetical protein
MFPELLTDTTKDFKICGKVLEFWLKFGDSLYFFICLIIVPKLCHSFHFPLKIYN